MPIEIKELHIKATVGGGSPTDGKRNGASDRNQQKMKDELLKECVEEVMQILKEKEER